MDALAKLLAEITEFLVGGVLLVISLTVLAYVCFPDDVAALADRKVPESIGGALTIAAVAVMYAFGVMVESASRMLLERWLTAMTVATPEFGGQPAPEPPTGWLRAVLATVFFDRSLLARPRSEEAIALRERWRTEATNYRESLGNTIEAQLKRLRIERTFAVCSAIVLVATVIAQVWVLVPVTALLVALSFRVVLERFGRYLKAIVRAHAIMEREGRSRPDTGVPTGASA